jgi:hypothetical protein
MKLYHGSRQRLDALEKRQATAGAGVDVPEGELRNAVYLTPNYDFAVACAARPDGVTDIDDEARTIRFEHSAQFDPEMPIYIYEFESDVIPAERLEQIDPNQYVYSGPVPLVPINVTELKAKEVLEHYKLQSDEPLLPPLR